MQALLLVVHIVGSILFVGGSAIATSLFPRYAPLAVTTVERSRAVATALHRITRGYSIAGLIVPAAGLVLAVMQGRTMQLWVVLAMILTAVAGGLLALQIYPRQRDALAPPGDRAGLRTLSILAGVYNLLWTAIVVLMVVQPGSGAAG
ncbi:hypothetical protein C1I98_24800 [Spongiactinospora gelatinilytica]|uniref:Integral membrane protein n=1 Tax=Spongiactinospora gelatinilytica TaxID=2666298 RepID=A0A2W2FR73_9ACTN|nr:hypothetical protein [Spongiactinospora gelatinilytica]PZG38062.1 hypothetical protein C1I98_24800 [Spongiactinospora gelatinilytica]